MRAGIELHGWLSDGIGLGFLGGWRVKNNVYSRGLFNSVLNRCRRVGVDKLCRFIFWSLTRSGNFHAGIESNNRSSPLRKLPSILRRYSIFCYAQVTTHGQFKVTLNPKRSRNPPKWLDSYMDIDVHTVTCLSLIALAARSSCFSTYSARSRISSRSIVVDLFFAVKTVDASVLVVKIEIKITFVFELAALIADVFDYVLHAVHASRWCLSRSHTIAKCINLHNNSEI